MNDSVKLNLLIDRLLARTISGKLRWKKGVKSRSFQADFPDYSIIVRSNVGLEVALAGEYEFEIINEKGEAVLSIPGEQGNMHKDMPDDVRGKVRKLLDAIQGSELPSSVAIDAILSRLGA